MDWGLLQGLGQGLQQIGGWKMEQDAEKRRTMLAQKLEQDREERAKRAYDPSQDSVEQGDEGLWFKVKRNKNGEVIDRSLAPKNVIDQMESETKKRGLQDRLLNAQVSNAEYSGSRAKIEDSREDANYNLLTPEEKRQEARYKAGLDITPAQKLSSETSLQNTLTRSSGKSSSSANEPTLAEYADNVLEQKPALVAEYVDSSMLTKNEAKSAILNVLKAFNQRGVKPSDDNFRTALTAYVEWKKKNKGSDSGKIKLGN